MLDHGLVRVSVAPGDDEIVVRIPDLQTLVAAGWLPVPLCHAVTDSVSRHVDDDIQWIIEADPETAAIDRLNAWVCACAVCPRVVLDQRDASTDTLHVDELPQMLKLAIYAATHDRLVRQLQARAARMRAFVATGMPALTLDAVARRYGKRPSDLMGLTDSYEAFDFDCAIATRGAAYEAALVRQQAYRVH